VYVKIQKSQEDAKSVVEFSSRVSRSFLESVVRPCKFAARINKRGRKKRSREGSQAVERARKRDGVTRAGRVSVCASFDLFALLFDLVEERGRLV